MTLHWYSSPDPGGDTLDEMLERLRPIGVRWAHSYDSLPVSYRFIDGELMAEIGAITVRTDTGIIGVWPAGGIGRAEQRVLCGSAQRAFEHAPRKCEGWRYFRRGGVGRWRGYILVPVHDQRLSHLVANHHASMYFDRDVVLTGALLGVAGEVER